MRKRGEELMNTRVGRFSWFEYIAHAGGLWDLAIHKQTFSIGDHQVQARSQNRNKAELTRLQRQFDSCVNEIETLERSKVIGASTAAYGIGIAGCAFLAGSVFTYLGGALVPCIVLAIPGFLGWIVPYFCFNKIRKSKTEKVSPLIDQKYDEVYEVCEKANGLLGV